MPDKQQRQQNLAGQEKPACAFCDLIKNREKSRIVFEDSETIAFLDVRPLFPGHLLLIPKKHYSAIEEIPEDALGLLFSNAKLLSGAVERGLGADGSFIAVNNKVSQSVPHLHIHIVPRRFKDGLKGFFWPRYTYKSEDEIADIQAKIISALAGRTDAQEKPQG